MSTRRTLSFATGSTKLPSQADLVAGFEAKKAQGISGLGTSASSASSSSSSSSASSSSATKTLKRKRTPAVVTDEEELQMKLYHHAQAAHNKRMKRDPHALRVKPLVNIPVAPTRTMLTSAELKKKKRVAREKNAATKKKNKRSDVTPKKLVDLTAIKNYRDPVYQPHLQWSIAKGLAEGTLDLKTLEHKKGYPNRKLRDWKRKYEDGDTALEDFRPRGQPKLSAAAQDDLVALVQARAIFSPKPGTRPNPFNPTETFALVTEVIRSDREDRTGLASKKPPCKKTVEQYIAALKLPDKKPRTLTKARTEAMDDPHALISHIVQMERLFGVLLDAMYAWAMFNTDAFALLIDASTNTVRTIPGGLEDAAEDLGLTYRVQAEPGSNSSLNEFGSKVYAHLTAHGRLAAVVAVQGDRTLPKGVMIKSRPIRGLFNSPDGYGYHVICNATHPTVEFNLWLLEEVLRPSQVAMREACWTPDTAHPKLLPKMIEASDGEREFTQAQLDPKQKAQRRAINSKAVKYVRSMSWASNINDAGSMHADAHAYARSGSQAAFADPFIEKAHNEAMDAAFTEYENSPENTTKWTRVKIVNRQRALAKHIHPILCAAFTREKILDAATSLGIKTNKEGRLHLDRKTIYRLWGAGPKAQKIFNKVIPQVKKQAALEKRGELSNAFINKNGFEQYLAEFTPPNPKKKPMDQRVFHHRNFVIYDEYDDKAHQKEVLAEAEEVKRLKLEAKERSKAETVERNRLKKEAKKAENAEKRAEKQKAKAAAKPAGAKQTKAARNKLLAAARAASQQRGTGVGDEDEQCATCPMWWSDLETSGAEGVGWQECPWCNGTWCSDCRTDAQQAVHETFCTDRDE